MKLDALRGDTQTSLNDVVKAQLPPVVMYRITKNDSEITSRVPSPKVPNIHVI